MPLYYRNNGNTYACYYYNSLSDLNGPSIVNPSTAHIRVRTGGSIRYLGVVDCNQTAPYSSTHECASHLRVRKNGVIYAIATHSKEDSVNIGSGGPAASYYTVPSTSYLPRVSGSGRGSGRSSGGGGGGGGGALAERTAIIFQYCAAASTGGAGRGQGSAAGATTGSYSADLTPGTSYRWLAGGALGSATAYNGGGGGGSKVHKTTGNAIASAGGGGSGPASLAGAASNFGIGTTSFTTVLKTWSGAGALGLSGGSSSGGTATRTTGSGSTYARATGGNGGSGTGGLSLSSSATTSTVYRNNGANVTIYGAAGSGLASGGGANMRLSTASYGATGGTKSGTTVIGSHGSVSLTIKYWARGN